MTEQATLEYLLHQEMEQTKTSKERILLPPTLIIRQSTGKRKGKP